MGIIPAVKRQLKNYSLGEVSESLLMNSANERCECRLMIVDDDLKTLFLVEHALKAAFPGAHITTLTDGCDALKTIRKLGTDLLITDHSMTRMNGADLIRELRAEGSKLPIIMISNSPNAEEEGNAAGANRFMEKGNAMACLPEAVRNLLASKS
jgi:DNA-binding response OmpR family regulator